MVSWSLQVPILHSQESREKDNLCYQSYEIPYVLRLYNFTSDREEHRSKIAREGDIEIQNLRQNYTQDIENMKEQMLTIEKSQVETRNLLHELRLRNMKLSVGP